MFPCLVAICSVAPAAVEVIRSDQVPAGLHDDYSSLVQCPDQLLAVAIQRIEYGADLLLAKNELVPVRAAVLLSETNGCLSDAPLVDA